MTEFGAAAAIPEHSGPRGQHEHVEQPPVPDNPSVSGAQIVPIRQDLYAQQPSVTAATEPTSKLSRWIAAAVVVGIATSLLLTYFGSFMIGLLTLACVIAAIGFLRAALSDSAMALFASRNRVIDSALYFGFALALLALAIGIPQ